MLDELEMMNCLTEEEYNSGTNDEKVSKVSKSSWKQFVYIYRKLYIKIKCMKVISCLKNIDKTNIIYFSTPCITDFELL